MSDIHASAQPITPSGAVEVVRAFVYAVNAGREVSVHGRFAVLDALDVLAREVA